jgi:hypothetical protein
VKSFLNTGSVPRNFVKPDIIYTSNPNPKPLDAIVTLRLVRQYKFVEAHGLLKHMICGLRHESTEAS